MHAVDRTYRRTDRQTDGQKLYGLRTTVHYITYSRTVETKRNQNNIKSNENKTWFESGLIRHWARKGATENAGLENAGPENAAPDCRGGKRGTGKRGTRLQGWKTRE